MGKSLLIAAAVAAPFVALGATLAVSSWMTEREIAAHKESVRRIARTNPSPALDPAALAALPPPVQRYLRFALPEAPRGVHTVELAMEGQFRRPLTEGFGPTTATQVIATGTPAMMFAATTPIIPGVWARAYDYFAEGRMEMRAKIASTLTVVDERETEALNRTSLRRWLLESPLYPVALLPGGPVRWEAVDDRRARAIVSGFGLEASMVATFRADGSLERFDAEQDGDLNAPYHGSGEHVTRTDYRRVQGMMILHGFEIARAAGGRLYPFWRVRLTGISFRFGN